MLQFIGGRSKYILSYFETKYVLVYEKRIRFAPSERKEEMSDKTAATILRVHYKTIVQLV